MKFQMFAQTLLCVLVVNCVFANGSYTWKGTNAIDPSAWNAPDNWTPNGSPPQDPPPPSGFVELVYPTLSESGSYSSINDENAVRNGLTIYSITITSEGDVPYQISGNKISGNGSINPIPLQPGAQITIESMVLKAPTLAFFELNGDATIQSKMDSSIKDQFTTIDFLQIPPPGQSTAGPLNLIATGDFSGFKLGDNKDYSGGMICQDAIIQATSNTSFGAVGSAVTLNQNSSIQAFGDHTISNTLTLASSGTIDSYGSTVTLSGGITGPGTLIILDSLDEPGSVILTNSSNSYSGGTILSNGTLTVKNGSLGPNKVTLNGAKSVLQADALDPVLISNPFELVSGTFDCKGQAMTLNGLITGTGSLSVTSSVANAGSVTLAGANNSYAGGTKIGSTTLIVSNEQAISSLGVVDLSTSDSKIKFTSSSPNYTQTFETLQGVTGSLLEIGSINLAIGAGVYSGNILGTGLLTKVGAGTFTLTGSNTRFWGNTLVTAGTLEISDPMATGSGIIALSERAKFKAEGLTLANLISLSGSPTIEVGAGTLTLNEGFFGGGSLIKEGLGTLKLNETNSASENVLVNEGGLAVIGGMLTSQVTVAAGATLSGTGTIIGNVINKGNLAPGASVGTLTIVGDYTHGAQAIFSNEINAIGSDQLIVQGNIGIENQPTFALIPEAGVTYALGSSYEVMTTNGEGAISGRFAKVTTTNPAVNGLLSYYEDKVILTLLGNTLFPTNELRGNPQRVASALDALFLKGDHFINEVFHSLLSLNSEQLYHALDQIHPAMYKGMSLVQENNAVLVRSSLSQRLHHALNEYKPLEKGHITKKTDLSIWATGLGDDLHQSAAMFFDSPQVGYRAKTGGAILGIDYSLLDQLSIGMLGGYSHSGLKWADMSGQGTIQSGYSALYAAAVGELFYGNFSVTGAWSEFKAQRNIVYPGVAHKAWSTHSGRQLAVHIESGIHYSVNEFMICPYDSLDWNLQREDGLYRVGRRIL